MNFKEPLDVDLSIGHSRVTQKDLNEISEFIRNYKEANEYPKQVVSTKRMPTTFRRKKELA